MIKQWEENVALLKEYIRENWHRAMKEPSGLVRYKFMDPAASYRGQLWDWDSFFCGVALMDVYPDTAEYVQGCAMNFMDHMRKDGSIPYVINTNSPKGIGGIPGTDLEERSAECDLNSMKPLLAQMILLAHQKIADTEWIVQNWEKLERHIAHWEATQQKSNGLFVWRSMRGSGADNHPAIYGRPLNSSAGVELNCLMYQEYLAMQKIAQLCKDDKASNIYAQKAEILAKAINEHMWDEIDGLYYHLDMLSQRPVTANQEISWDVPMKFRSWTCFMPMWAGIAPKEYAERMVREHLMNPEEFYSEFGLRTLAKNEKLYNTVESGNPSNWQGPIWIISTYLIVVGLWKYGYQKEAKQVTENLINMLCQDLRENGLLHEYYNPETGRSNINAGFMNWNALAGVMTELIEEGQAI